MSVEDEPQGNKPNKPIAEWVLGLGVILGMFFPWMEVAGMSFTGMAMATIDLMTGKVPGEISIFCLLFIFTIIITLLLPLSPSAWWARSITIVIASGLFGVTVFRLGENTELSAQALIAFGAGPARPGLGLLISGGFLLLLLIVTLVSVIGESIRRRRSVEPAQA